MGKFVEMRDTDLKETFSMQECMRGSGLIEIAKSLSLANFPMKFARNCLLENKEKLIAYYLSKAHNFANTKLTSLQTQIIKSSFQKLSNIVTHFFSMEISFGVSINDNAL